MDELETDFEASTSSSRSLFDNMTGWVGVFHRLGEALLSSCSEIAVLYSFGWGYCSFACSLLCCVFTWLVLEIIALWRIFFSVHPFVEPKK